MGFRVIIARSPGSVVFIRVCSLFRFGKDKVVDMAVDANSWEVYILLHGKNTYRLKGKEHHRSVMDVFIQAF